jgi:hypothetical protein
MSKVLNYINDQSQLIEVAFTFHKLELSNI